MLNFLTLEDEIPKPVNVDVPFWSENYCFDAFDAEKNIGFWIHLGRWSCDPEIWREQVYVFLPDGSFMLQRSFGTGDLSRGPRGALLRLECERPGERWRIRYDGPARRTTAAELERPPISDGPLGKLSFDLSFEATGTVWDFFGKEKHTGTAFSDHFEQPGVVVGIIEYDGLQVKMNGVGYRDHSRGPRNLVGLFAEEWIHGHFPDGISFGLLRLDKLPGQGSEIQKGAIWKDGNLHIATIETTGGMKSPDLPIPCYSLTFNTEVGKFEIEARVLRTLTISLTNRFEFFYGANPTAANAVAFEQPSSFWRNGIRGVGHTERSIVF
jgi:hypothetical protein